MEVKLKDDFFKVDCEFHLVGDVSRFDYYPGCKRWWRAADGISKMMMSGLKVEHFEGLENWEMEKQSDPEVLLKIMDKYEIDVACLLPESMMETTNFESRWCTNTEMARIVERYPQRFVYHPNISPIKYRGVKNAIWELEYWNKEKGAKLFKFYPPEDTFINDPELWPFYEKAEELGVILCIHTGFCWVAPGKSKYCLPILLEDVLRDFPELKIIAFHMGYPYCDDLNMIGMQYPNLYLSLSLLCTWALSFPRKFARILGEALRFVGPDRIVWGSDFPGFSFQVKWSVEGFRNFKMPHDLQEQYGYPEVTDEIKKKIFGENLARLLGIDTKIRKIGLR